MITKIMMMMVLMSLSSFQTQNTSLISVFPFTVK